MEITWEADDGYAGASRPQHIEVPDEELRECETAAERRKLIEEYVEDDFRCTVSWYIEGAPWEEEPEAEEEAE